MKVRVNKRWWQFWLPPSIDIESALNYRGLPVVLDKDAPSSTLYLANEQLLDMDGVAAAIESDGQEPSWHNEPDEESSVITAEPPIVYASRGNAEVARKQGL